MITKRQQRLVSVEHTIAAAPDVIFAVLADPAQHAAIDGSRTLLSTENRSTETSLDLGSTFSTLMNRSLRGLRMADLIQSAIATACRGRMRNTVVEFVENERIAWRNFGRYIWRYELNPVDDGARTLVTETFDYPPNPAPWLLEIAGFPKRNAAAMTATLLELDHLCASQIHFPDGCGSFASPHGPRRGGVFTSHCAVRLF